MAVAARKEERQEEVGLFDDYSPHPKAWRAFKDDAKNLLMLAGRRGAKTHTGAKRFLRLIYEKDLPAAMVRAVQTPYRPGAARRGTAMWWKRRPRLHYWIVAETYDLLKEPMRYLLQFLPPHLLEHADAGENAIWLKPDILVEFKTVHDPKRAVGSGLAGIWVEEAARIGATAWEGFISHGLADNDGWAQFTTTPLGQDWTFEAIEKHARAGAPGYSFHAWKTTDNIRAPNVITRAAEAKLRLPPAYYKREYEASREAFEGQIYAFDEATMVKRPPLGKQFVRRLGCQDWGFSAPGAHIVLGLTSNDPRACEVWALEEVYSDSQLVEDFWVPEVLKVMARHRYREVVADPAEPDNIWRFKSAGIHCVGHKNFSVAKYDEHERSVRAGIRAMAALIHQKRFYVDPSCKNLISELLSYRWDQYKTGAMSLIERPAPGQKEHAATACRYGVSYALKGSVLGALDIAA
jgi:hypothetical protein